MENCCYWFYYYYRIYFKYIAYILLNKCKNPLEFVLTYKLSQDHLKRILVV